MCHFKQILEAAPHKTTTLWPLVSFLTNHIGKINETCWWSRDELIIDILFWNPAHGHTSIGCQAKIYIYQQSRRPARVWKNSTLSSHTILTINIYLRMTPRIAIKQCVPLFSIKPFTRKPFQWKSLSSLQKCVPLTLLSTSFLRTNLINLSYSLTCSLY